MARLTSMTLDEARALGRAYGLMVAGLQPVLYGSVNSNFTLALEGGGSAFLRIYEESSRAEVQAQNRLLARLVSAGVPTPAPLDKTDGGRLGEHAGKPVAVFPFCEGSWICQRGVDVRRTHAIGMALARIHLATAEVADAPPSRFGATQLFERIETLTALQLDHEIESAVVRLAESLRATASATAGHPSSVVTHGDVFRDNVLWHDDGRLSAILDFESASRGHPAFDLMVTMHAWCFADRFEPPLVHALVAGYQSLRPLTAQERAACYHQARAAAVRFAITRISDYELRPRGAVVYKDFRRFLARLDEVEAIGAELFEAWLGL